MTLTSASVATPGSSPLRGVAEVAVDHAVGEAAPTADVQVLRTDLTDTQFRALWHRLQVVSPSLESFAPSPQLAANALEHGIGEALHGGWVEIRRLGGVTGDAWAVRAGGLDSEATDLLGKLLEGPQLKPYVSPEVVARRQRIHRINMRIALALALVALGGMLALQPLVVFPT